MLKTYIIKLRVEFTLLSGTVASLSDLLWRTCCNLTLEIKLKTDWFLVLRRKRELCVFVIPISVSVFYVTSSVARLSFVSPVQARVH